MSHDPRNIDWYDLAEGQAREIITTLMEYYGAWHLPLDENLVTRALVEQPEPLVTLIKEADMIAMSRAAVICQMPVYDDTGGPEGDWEPKGLRRSWYAYYKTDFALPYSLMLGKDPNDPNWQRDWFQRMSATYSEIVDTMKVTYQDLWVNDSSRMMLGNHQRLFHDLHVIICVEKDSQFEDFTAAASALGAAVYSGKGKSSRAGIERLLREHFGWSEDYNPFDDNPLYILSLSDYDYDGEAVIGKTFAAQASRYTSNITWTRVGVNPDNLHYFGVNYQDKWYRVKVPKNNVGYKAWAEEKSLTYAHCPACGADFIVQGAKKGQHYCQNFNCPGNSIDHTKLVLDEYEAYGFELEALKSRQYYELVAKAFSLLVGWDDIIENLRDECYADEWDAAERIMRNLADENEQYQKLLRASRKLNDIKWAFESKVRDALMELGRPHIYDFKYDDDDPDEDEFVEYVKHAYKGSGPWRPFNRSDRTASLVDMLLDDYAEEVNEILTMKLRD